METRSRQRVQLLPTIGLAVCLALAGLGLAGCAGDGEDTEAAVSQVVDGEIDIEGDVGSWSTIEQEADDHDHVYAESHVDATCSCLGYYVYTCTVCGYVYYGESEYGYLADHDYVEAVDGETGETIYVCSVCGQELEG